MDDDRIESHPAGNAVHPTTDDEQLPCVQKGKGRADSLELNEEADTIKPGRSSIDQQNEGLHYRSGHGPPSSTETPVRVAPSIPRSMPGRDRGYSLRTKLFKQAVQQRNADPLPVIAGSSRQDLYTISSRLEMEDNESKSKKGSSRVTVTPSRDGDDLWLAELQKREQPSAITRARFGLSRVEEMVSVLKQKSTDALSRTIGHILPKDSKPASSGGRRITIIIPSQAPLIDKRTGNPFIDNTIRSNKYTLWSFFPRQLYYQFRKLANFYFLIVAILQMIPGLSTTGTYTTIIPLLVFVGISMGKEGYEDSRRRKLDRVENNSLAKVLGTSSAASQTASDSEQRSGKSIEEKDIIEKRWCDIRVGEVVKLQRNDQVPADLLLLHAEHASGVAFIETMALDGETNLKSKIALAIPDQENKLGIASLEAEPVVTIEDPNIDLYSCSGKIEVNGRTLPLLNDLVLYRGSVLRNTPFIYGLVVYTGEECKIRMNAATKPRIKAPRLQAAVNRIVFLIVPFVLALAIGCTVAYQLWKPLEKRSWYIFGATVSFIPIVVSYIIIFNTMIPLSLYVSLEIIKVFQVFLMQNDLKMFDEASGTPMEARTTTLNEELGQVTHVFSDKTGTLTNNSMKFRKLSVFGTAWLHDSDLDHPDQVRDFVARKIALADDNIRRLLQYMQASPETEFAKAARFFLVSLALCHTCIPEIQPDGTYTFQATSVDELALVQAAQEMGFLLIDRQSNSITLKETAFGAEEKCETYQILQVLEFSSKRKRMSIIVRFPDGRICLMCKGADSAVLPLLRLAEMVSDKARTVEARANVRKSMEAQEAVRRKKEYQRRSIQKGRNSIAIGRPSLSAIGRPSFASARSSGVFGGAIDVSARQSTSEPVSPMELLEMRSPRPISFSPSTTGRSSSARVSQDMHQNINSIVPSDDWIFEQCFQHVNDFATEGLRTLLFAHRFIKELDFNIWKKTYDDASTSLVDRQVKIDAAAEEIERDLELTGATAIEDKLQEGVPETIDLLRNANMTIWMLTGDKRETAINIGRASNLILSHSHLTVLDHQSASSLWELLIDTTRSIAASPPAHSVVVLDGSTFSIIISKPNLLALFTSLATKLTSSLICTRLSPAQKATLITTLRHALPTATTLAIGDGSNDIAMIREAHIGIGITASKEGTQAARTADYTIAQFRFLAPLLLVHGRWNYIRTCKYVLGTFWKEMGFYLTQAWFQIYCGWTGTSLFESWSLTIWNTVFTSLAVIFLGIFEQDVPRDVLLRFPELYAVGQKNGAFNFWVYLRWASLAVVQSVLIFFSALFLYDPVSTPPSSQATDLYALGTLCFTIWVIIINVKLQFIEIHNKTWTAALSILLSLAGWFLWDLILAGIYSNNTVYDARGGFTERWGRDPSWWATLMVVLMEVWVLEFLQKWIVSIFWSGEGDDWKAQESLRREEEDTRGDEA
ncbi:hypothetical protein MMC25_008185 [Agyrium rufum]|nr:hypothetical protein [Agyrium rufum]